MLKKVLIHTRRSMKLMILLSVAAILIASAVIFFYKTTYVVTINGVEVGYTQNKSALQKRINEYMENGDGSDEHIAYIQIQDVPDYEMCLLKRDVETNDDEIFEKIKEEGIKYYRYYAILEDQEEKQYVGTFNEAEKIIEELKEKNSDNIDKLSIAEKYETELKELTTTEAAVTALYQPKSRVTASKKKSYTTYQALGSVNTATTIAGGAPNLGISLIRPVTGKLSSKFGEKSRLRSSYHTGLDIATTAGRPVAAAASGTVTFSGWKGAYGNLLVITHENGVQTYYGHCSALYVSTGAHVSQGQKIAAVGSTGNSTGAHLHFEVRLNGIAYNPLNYV